MIKFFKKIRQGILSEEKTGEYLKYALGEIILVVIGILIALQINNWNERRKLDNKGIELMTDLSQELEGDVKTLTSVVSRLKHAMEVKDYVLKLDNFNSVSIDSLRFIVITPNLDVMPNQETHNKIKSLGITKMTKNEELNENIFNYFGSMNKVQKSIKFFFDNQLKRDDYLFHEQNTISFNDNINAVKNLSEEEFRKIAIDFINTPRVQNLILESYWHSNESLLRLDRLNIEICNLLNDIYTELGTPDDKKLANLLSEKEDSIFNLDKRNLDSFVGKYKGPYEIEIKSTNGELTAYFKKTKYKIVPKSLNTFEVRYSAIKKFQFQSSDNGKIDGFEYTNFNESNKFKKVPN